MEFTRLVKLLSSTNDISNVKKEIGYVPCGRFTDSRSSNIIEAIIENVETGAGDAAALARDISIITGAPLKLSAAWVYSTIEDISPRSSINPLMIYNKESLSLFFYDDGEKIKPVDLETIIEFSKELMDAAIHDIRVRESRLKRLGVI